MTRSTLHTSLVVLLHLSSLLPLANSIATAGSPEYSAEELTNGTILVFEPNATATNASQVASYNATEQEQQPAFVYNEADLFGLESSSENATATAANNYQLDSFDFVGTQESQEKTTGGGTSNTYVQQGFPDQAFSAADSESNAWSYGQEGYLVKQARNSSNKKRNKRRNRNKNKLRNKDKNVTANDGYSFGQEGYLVHEDTTVDSKPGSNGTQGNFSYQQTDYLDEEKAEDASDGNNSSKQNAMETYLGNKVGGGGRRNLRGA